MGFGRIKFPSAQLLLKLEWHFSLLLLWRAEDTGQQSLKWKLLTLNLFLEELRLSAVLYEYKWWIWASEEAGIKGLV